MLDILKGIIGISGTDYDVILIYFSVALCLYFMKLFYDFISSIFHGVSR